MSASAIAYTIQREPELLGQTVVVIGGSAGIGLEATRSRSTDGVLDVKLSVPDLSKTSGPLDPGTRSHAHESNVRARWPLCFCMFQLHSGTDGC